MLDETWTFVTRRIISFVMSILHQKGLAAQVEPSCGRPCSRRQQTSPPHLSVATLFSRCSILACISLTAKSPDRQADKPEGIHGGKACSKVSGNSSSRMKIKQSNRTEHTNQRFRTRIFYFITM
ncbi:hypothetical protein HanPI659440_Chr13g0513391 [Helianthus annuus]|nr:hypothetical protein HanPI659440_Chr13g0513391 [Helianthus annuus]